MGKKVGPGRGPTLPTAPAWWHKAVAKAAETTPMPTASSPAKPAKQTSEDGKAARTSATSAGDDDDASPMKPDFIALCSALEASANEDHPSDDESNARPLKQVPTVVAAPRRSPMSPKMKNARESAEYRSRAAERDRWLESLGVTHEEDEKKSAKVHVTVAVPLRERTEGVKDETRRWIERMQRHERGSFGSALLVASRS